MLIAAILGVDFTLVCPTGFEPEASLLDKAMLLAEQSGSQMLMTSSVAELGTQDVIYTDTWVSMGQEGSQDHDEILTKFAPYQVNHQMMKSTGATAVMHCQPAHLEEEISTDLFDSELSIVFQQAENRMWAQNAILVTLLAQ
jgi:ornithine carbamoyltransferase